MRVEGLTAGTNRKAGEAWAPFMKNASVEEILANTKLWGEDLSDMVNEVKKYADK